MKSPVRLFFILPIIFFFLTAFMQLLFNSFFAFALWAFVALLVFLICWPIIVKANIKYVPIYQIFSILIGFLIIVAVASFFDFKQYITLDKAIILSVFTSIIITGLVMFFRGNDS